MRRALHLHRARRAAPLVSGLAALGAVTVLAVSSGYAQTPPAPPVTLASGSLTKLVGQRVTLTARVGSLPPGAYIVMVGVRANGRTIFRRTCATRARVCVLRVFTSVAQSVRFRAFVRLRGRTLRSSRILTVTWRRPPKPPPPASPTPTLTDTVTQDGPSAGFCGPSPTTGNGGTATYSAPFGTIVGRWELPRRITAGATATIELTIQPAPGQRLSGGVRVKTPSEFGASTPSELSGFADVGGSYSQSLTITFTPRRKFVAGEKLYIRLENPCAALIYEYVAS